MSVTSFCEGLALGLEVEVTFTYKSHRTRIVGGTGINTLDLDGLHYVYSRPTKLRQEK
ncbi:MAG: hypothetical protein ACRD4R_12975 [Candidatus Acidiferrales bacterium]